MAKLSALLVPPALVTVTVAVPGAALAETPSVAIIWVELTTVTPETEIPELALTVEPATKFVPVKVTATVDPVSPMAGLIDVSVGGGGVMLKVTGGLVPYKVVSVTVAAPKAALAAMVKVAVSSLELITPTLETDTPGLLTATVPVAKKFVPVNVTGTLAPASPLAGVIDVMVGAQEEMLNRVAAASFWRKRGTGSVASALGLADSGVNDIVTVPVPVPGVLKNN
jgi:hypothetical protein